MISERDTPITLINGIPIKSENTRGSKIKHNYDYIDENQFKETQEEWSRILNNISKPCPSDFPKELKPYWKGYLEFSLTPYESGWMYLNERRKTKRRK